MVSKSYMNNLELKSMHYWFKKVPTQETYSKYSNVLKIMRNTIYETDVLDIIGSGTQKFTNPNSRATFYQRALLRNVFEHWKMYVVHKLLTRRATYKANYFYQKKLQKKVLNVLSKNVLSKWKHIVSSMNMNIRNSIVFENDKAEKYYLKILLKKCFKHWLMYIVIIKKERQLAEKVPAFCNAYCLRKYLAKWKMYITLREEKQILHEKVVQAKNLYSRNIMQNCLRAWLNIYQFARQKREMESVIKHHENKLLVKYFYHWKIYHTYKMEKLILTERVLEHHRRTLLKRYFKQFITSVNESIAQKALCEDAELFYNLKLVRKVFFGWQKWYNKKVENSMKIYENRCVLEGNLKRKMLINWRLYVTRKKCKRRKVHAAEIFYGKKMAGRMLQKFRKYVSYRKQKKVELSHIKDRSVAISKQLQIAYIDKWRRALYCAMQQKQELQRAIKFWECNLTRQYFAHWKAFSVYYKLKQVRKRQLNEIAAGYLVKKFILQWHSKLHNVLAMHRKMILAVSVAEQKITTKYFSAWKVYIDEKIRTKDSIEAAIELHKKFLLREGLKEVLRNSLRIIEHQSDMQLETATRRSLKNFEILKEYFDRWYLVIYVKNKSQHPRRIANNNNNYQLEGAAFDSFKPCLVFPKYMVERSATPNPYNSWTYNLYSHADCNVRPLVLEDTKQTNFVYEPIR